MTEPIERDPELVFHAAAWTDVDGAEAEPDAARRVNVEGTRNVVALGVPVVYFSTDYVFDGEKRAPYVESDEPRPLSVYGRTKLQGEREIGPGWIVRSSWLFGSTGKNFVRTMFTLASERTEVQVVAELIAAGYSVDSHSMKWYRRRKRGGRAAIRKAIEEAVTSNTGEKYPEYYGGWYDEVVKPKDRLPFHQLFGSGRVLHPPRLPAEPERAIDRDPCPRFCAACDETPVRLTIDIPTSGKPKR